MLIDHIACRGLGFYRLPRPNCQNKLPRPLAYGILQKPLWRQWFLHWPRKAAGQKRLPILWLPGNLQKPLAAVTFPHLEHHGKPYRWMDATLAPRRNQLDPLENHWNSLHFQCAALMRNNARQRHPGGQSGNLMVIAKSSKTIGCSDILRSRDAYSRIQYLEKVFAVICLWFELRAIHAETLQTHRKS